VTNQQERSNIRKIPRSVAKRCNSDSTLPSSRQFQCHATLLLCHPSSPVTTATNQSEP